eukprot:12532867-Alexandrium_andersonii.AAC.1
MPTAQRSASDLAVGPWDQDPAYAVPRTGPRTSQQWAVWIWNRVADWVPRFPRTLTPLYLSLIHISEPTRLALI